MRRIIKKILPQYYEDVVSNRKTFELRKDEDQAEPGDYLVLREWDGEKYTGEAVLTEITYVLRDVPQYGLMDGYCIIGIRKLGPCIIGDNEK
jgi:hypothetical protein